MAAEATAATARIAARSAAAAAATGATTAAAARRLRRGAARDVEGRALQQCSQLVMLFLKRCVRRGVLPLPGEREFLLGTYTPTCLPRQLMDLVLRLWPGPVEVRDMGKIPQDLRLWWFGRDGLPPPDL